MLPTIVLLGRPNVGKSTLFNRLTRSRKALIADMPGLTRDRHYGRAVYDGKPYLLVDTGGFEPDINSDMTRAMAKQTLLALDEADSVLFMVDGREGLTLQDEAILPYLRRLTCPVYLIVNKTEGMAGFVVSSEFYTLGLGEPWTISSAHGEGVYGLMSEVLRSFEQEEPAAIESASSPRIAIVGRPNVGKSTLINALLVKSA